MSNAAVYKSGTGTRVQGHGDACVGTWDLGTRDEGLEDIKYGTRGRQKQGRRGRGMSHVPVPVPLLYTAVKCRSNEQWKRLEYSQRL